MSSSSTPVTTRHFDYVARLTRQELPVLADLKAAASKAGIPEIWISPEQASYMQILLKLTSAKNVVEVGTLAGYSAINMALALPEDGVVRTIELEPSHAKFAREWIEKTPAKRKVEVLVGDGREILPGFADGWADAAFIDADKAGYQTYVHECLRIVRKGGLIMCDNAFAFGNLFEEGEVEPSVHHIRAFNEEMAKISALHGMISPVGDGCWVAVRES